MSNSDVDAEYDTDDVDADVDPNPYERGKWLSGLIALIGAWMVLQVFLFDMVASQFWNDIIAGGLLLLAGGYNYARRGRDQVGSVGAAAVAALVGLWLVVAPFVLGADASAAAEAENAFVFWNDVVVGLITLGIGAFSAYAARDQKQEARALGRET
ncbi:SPW repeat domain-containing protein [Halorussus sp. AFM4]|uniref:SPW repeat domain-containing protein n=1 Tax=Halorussus sp. AFM4 TaxID=3421651 RepID=UPI003EB78B96